MKKIIFALALAAAGAAFAAPQAEIDGEKHYPDAEYFVAMNDEAAIKHAKVLASQGWDYADVDHHVEGELVSVTLVDDENEFVDVKTIWE